MIAGSFDNNGNIIGTWKIFGGTGKYKKIKGSGKYKQVNGKPEDNPSTFAYSGKVTF